MFVKVERRGFVAYFAPLQILPFESAFIQFLVGLGGIFLEDHCELDVKDGLRTVAVVVCHHCSPVLLVVCLAEFNEVGFGCGVCGVEGDGEWSLRGD